MSMQTMIENEDTREIIEWDGEQDPVGDVCCQRRDFALDCNVEFVVRVGCFEGQIAGADDDRDLGGHVIGQSAAGGVKAGNGQKGQGAVVGHDGDGVGMVMRDLAI